MRQRRQRGAAPQRPERRRVHGQRADGQRPASQQEDRQGVKPLVSFTEKRVTAKMMSPSFLFPLFFVILSRFLKISIILMTL